jgi:NIPSNAP
VATELRDYRITTGELDRWVDEWRRHIAPLRRALGFTIERAWTVDEGSRFVWLLSYPGDWEAFEAADRAYYDSPQRTSLDPNPARLIEDQVTSRLVEIELP